MSGDGRLNEIETTLKTGEERLSFNGSILDYTLLDFWRWGVSDILSNATRGKFAEFIVAVALGVDIKKPSNEWAPYDLLTKDGLKIEVKTSAYIQSWYQKEYSKPVFSIRPARYWNSETSQLEKKIERHADIYVFCLLKEKDQKLVNPLKLEQWDFYVVATDVLNKKNEKQKSISLGALRKISKPVSYIELKSEVKNIKQTIL